MGLHVFGEKKKIEYHVSKEVQNDFEQNCCDDVGQCIESEPAGELNNTI